jgi:hypothetical protein
MFILFRKIFFNMINKFNFLFEGCLVVGYWKTIDWSWSWAYYICGNCIGFEDYIYIYIYILLLIFIFYWQNSKMKWNFICHSSWQVPVYIAEITPKNHRGGFTSAQQVKLMPCRWSSILSNSLIFIPFF